MLIKQIFIMKTIWLMYKNLSFFFIIKMIIEGLVLKKSYLKVIENGSDKFLLSPRIKMKMTSKTLTVKLSPMKQELFDQLVGRQKFEVQVLNSNTFKGNWIEPEDFSDNELFDEALNAVKRPRLEFWGSVK